MDNAHAAGADALFILPIGFIFIVLVVVAVLKHASPGRKPVVRIVVASHIAFWILVGVVAFRSKGRFLSFSLDAVDVYVTYPIVAALYLFYSYNLLNKIRNEKWFAYAILFATASAFLIAVVIAW